jgi:hypothetical protein
VSVHLSAAAGGRATEAAITYRLTSLSTAGDGALDAFAAGFPEMLAEWERRIDTYRTRQPSHGDGQ